MNAYIMFHQHGELGHRLKHAMQLQTRVMRLFYWFTPLADKITMGISACAVCIMCGKITERVEIRNLLACLRFWKRSS